MLYEQIRFIDHFEHDTKNVDLIFGGIGVYNGGELTGVICSCCGSFIEPKDVTVLEIMPWLDISDKIIGT